ncbi:MAG: PQQ-binding-like beta-propeller repeat protein [Pirellulaceae bacterium]|nr:PQQ-binding-like beta-propeller repeat protein [Pirellulaceae bacterium]
MSMITRKIVPQPRSLRRTNRGSSSICWTFLHLTPWRFLFFFFAVSNSIWGFDWPEFRGPTGQGDASSANLPLQWSEDNHVSWKVPIPGKGHSSPVISAGQIWLTTALADGGRLHAICFAESSGNLLYNVELFQNERPELLHADNSHATPTAVIDKGRIYVHFGANGTACLTSEGKVVWKTNALQYRQPYSGASSPVLFEDLLLLTCDGTDVQFVVALDKETGQVVWKTDRQHLERAKEETAATTGKRQGYSTMAYATGLLIEVAGGKQFVSPGADHVAAYNPQTGKEIWWLEYLGFSEVARPVIAGDLLIVQAFQEQSKPTLFAIHPTAQGRVNEKYLVWQRNKNTPHVPSPLVSGNLLFLVKDSGTASCLDVRTGKEHWTKRIGGNFSASSILAGNNVYCFSEEGTTTIFAAQSEFQLQAKNHIDGRIMASPAVSENALFVRTDGHLYRIEAPD